MRIYIIQKLKDTELELELPTLYNYTPANFVPSNANSNPPASPSTLKNLSKLV